MNMHLAALETPEEQRCIDEAIMSKIFRRFATRALMFLPQEPGYSFGLPGKILWNGGSDQFHEGKFVWVTPPREHPVLRSLRFNPGQPDNYKGNQNCLFSQMRTNYLSALDDDFCTQARGYMCEVFQHFFFILGEHKN
jgi:hypothetical protein